MEQQKRKEDELKKRKDRQVGIDDEPRGDNDEIVDKPKVHDKPKEEPREKPKPQPKPAPKPAPKPEPKKEPVKKVEEPKPEKGKDKLD